MPYIIEVCSCWWKSGLSTYGLESSQLAVVSLHLEVLPASCSDCACCIFVVACQRITRCGRFTTAGVICHLSTVCYQRVLNHWSCISSPALLLMPDPSINFHVHIVISLLPVAADCSARTGTYLMVPLARSLHSIIARQLVSRKQLMQMCSNQSKTSNNPCKVTMVGLVSMHVFTAFMPASLGV